MHEISIVVLTMNSRSCIVPCLDSILSQNSRHEEIIVVDNGSNDATAELIAERYPALRLLRNPKNLGASAGRNQGISHAKGDWILTLDCDVILHKDFFSRLYECIDTLPESTGMVQPKILRSDGSRIYSCGIHLSFLRRFYDIGQNQKDSPRFDELKDVFGICAAAGLYRRKMLDDIKAGGMFFDENFFFLVEDVDVAVRAAMKGWSAKFCPQARCLHQGNSSSLGHKKRQYLCWRNRRLLLAKCTTSVFRSLTTTLVYDIPRLIFLLSTNRYVRKDCLLSLQLALRIKTAKHGPSIQNLPL